MRWLIVEDALRDRKGHWFEYVRTFRNGLVALGDSVTVLASKEAKAFIQTELEAKPVLPEYIWHRMSDGSSVLKRYLRVQTSQAAHSNFMAFRTESLSLPVSARRARLVLPSPCP